MRIKNTYFIRTALLFVFFISLLNVEVYADKTKTALKALEKGEFDKVEEILQKSLSKNSLDPGSKYVYSILYTIDSFPRYNIDSAHLYIITAQKEFDRLDSKDQEGLIKDEITMELLSTHHNFVDSLAFSRAKSLQSLEGFDYFILNYSYSSQYPQAIEARNKVAFHHASQEGSWQSYKSFIDKYPKASELEKATVEYNKLIFEEKTKSGGLKELESFLEEHPQTPYRNTLEERIFALVSVFGEADQILKFIVKYQNQHLQKKGMDVLHYLHLENVGYQKVLKSKYWKAYNDSISSLEKINQAILVPYFENNKYGFANIQGDVVIGFQFDSLGSNYYCGNVTEEVLDITIGKTHMLVNRKLDTLYIGNFENHNDVGYGILKITKDNKAGAIHSTGFSILPFEYEEISILNKSLLKVKKSGKYGICSILGKEIMTPKYDDLYMFKDYLVFENKGRVSINLLDSFILDTEKKEVRPDFKFEDFEVVGNMLICFDGDNEVLLDSLLNIVVPFGEQRINTKFDTWAVKQTDGYRLFDKQSGKLQDGIYKKVLQNDQWLAVIGSNKWSLYSKSLSDVPMVGLDSVNLLGDDIALVFRDKTGMAIFPNKKIVEFSKDEKLRSISSGKNTDVHFLVISKDGKNILYKNGERVIESVYEIGYIADDVFSAKSWGEFGAMDTKARLIMRIRYDAIGEAENGISPVIYNGRFGAYNFNDRILISLKFDEKPKPYNDYLLITKFRGKKGLYSIKNENILETRFDEILYWNDSIALVKNLGQWSLHDIYSREDILSGISDFEFISTAQEKQVIKFRASTGMGVYSEQNGLLFAPTFNDIINLGTAGSPFYFCEKSVREAGYYVAVYKNSKGETIRTHAYRASEYERIVCEE